MSEAVMESRMVKVQFQRGRIDLVSRTGVNPVMALLLRFLYADRISLSVVGAIVTTLFRYPPLLRIIEGKVTARRAMLRYCRTLACPDTSRRRGQETGRRCGGSGEGVRDSQRPKTQSKNGGRCCKFGLTAEARMVKHYNLLLPAMEDSKAIDVQENSTNECVRNSADKERISEGLGKGA